jgi:hypothetical protein
MAENDLTEISSASEMSFLEKIGLIENLSNANTPQGTSTCQLVLLTHLKVLIGW